MRHSIIPGTYSQVRRTIVDGTTTLYSSSPNTHVGDVTTDEDWVWMNVATSPPRHAPSLDVVKIRDTGCLGLGDRMQRGWQGDNNTPREVALEVQLGDIYTRAGRCVRAQNNILPSNQPQTQLSNVSLIVCAGLKVIYVRTAGASTKCGSVQALHSAIGPIYGSQFLLLVWNPPLVGEVWSCRSPRVEESHKGLEAHLDPTFAVVICCTQTVSCRSH